MDLNLSVFQEPRGVMRIFHLVFSISAFATTVDYEGFVKVGCISKSYVFSYPFNIDMNLVGQPQPNNSCVFTTSGDFSSDSTFFVCTGVLAMLYSLAIIIVYTKFDKAYKTNEKIPLLDFILSVIYAILWLSSSAAWANGLSGLKNVTYPSNIIVTDAKICHPLCNIETSGFGSLNVSVVLGFLNFFLWAANLWFLYKETKWFQKPAPAPGV